MTEEVIHYTIDPGTRDEHSRDIIAVLSACGRPRGRVCRYCRPLQPEVRKGQQDEPVEDIVLSDSVYRRKIKAKRNVLVVR